LSHNPSLKSTNRLRKAGNKPVLSPWAAFTTSVANLSDSCLADLIRAIGVGRVLAIAFEEADVPKIARDAVDREVA
jgi:hypothetical protein